MDPTDKIVQRTYHYWYEDGLAELTGSVIMGLVAFFFYVQTMTPGGLVALILPVLAIGGGLAARRILRALKERITYPRTGYVAYRTAPRHRRWWTAVLAMALSGVIGVWVTRGGLPVNRLLFLQGWIIAIGFVVPGVRFGVRRFFWLALFSGLAGTLLARTSWSSDLVNAAYFAVIAAGVALSGAWTLWNYLRHTQPPTEA